MAAPATILCPPAMRLVTFLAPGSAVPRAGEVRDERVFAYAQEELTVLDRLADPEAVPVEGAFLGAV